jgi:NADPH-dependent curcumin reductase CurA
VWVVENLGIDRCIDYRGADFKEQLKDAFPNGIDVYSDGIAGSLTETVVEEIKQNGRLFSYGAAAAFYADQLTLLDQPFNMRKFCGISDKVDALRKKKNIKTECWMVDAFYHERLKAEDDLSRLMLSGQLKAIHNVVEGFEKLPQAITDLYRKHRSGKLQVRFDVGWGKH